tara:strand:- start:133 stop:477 length:345 start_codon:yes stop_codon:yes gene_type:complete
MHDNLCKDLKDKLNNDQFSPNSISHKELNTLLNKAKKEMLSSENSGSLETNKNQEFNDLITDWTNTSKKILLMLNQNDQIPAKNRNSKSLMAFGAMGAHINMALQALKSTELDW